MKMQPQILRFAQDDKPELMARVYFQGRSFDCVCRKARQTFAEDKKAELIHWLKRLRDRPTVPVVTNVPRGTFVMASTTVRGICGLFRVPDETMFHGVRVISGVKSETRH